jgi:hypothetical protein
LERKVFSVEGVKPVRKPSSIQQMASNLLGKLLTGKDNNIAAEFVHLKYRVRA